MNWPDNADGDTFRRLQSNGVDFNRAYLIDFNVDFDSWPPPPDAIEHLKEHYHNVNLQQEDQYVLVQLHATLSYEFVLRVQNDRTKLMRPYGGKCESWSVLI